MHDIIHRHTMGVSEVARVLEASEQTVRNHCQAKRLHPIRVGPKKTRYFDPAEVKQLALAMLADRAWKRYLYRLAPPKPRPRVELEPITVGVSGNGHLIRHDRELLAVG